MITFRGKRGILQRGYIAAFSIIFVFLTVMLTASHKFREEAFAQTTHGERQQAVVTDENTFPLEAALPKWFFPSALVQTIDDCPTDFEHQVIFLVNHQRSLEGLSALSLDIRLQVAARWMSNDMAAHDTLPSNHVDSLGREPGKRVTEEGGYPYASLGEVIAGGYATPAEVVEAWMNSPGHQAILMGDGFMHIGVGYAFASGTTFGHYWTADLGSTEEDRQAPLAECDPGFFHIFHPIVMK